MAVEKKKTTGSKLSRSEVVTVRFDPKLRYLAELAARKHRRTLSSFIEWAVESSLERVYLYEGEHYDDKTSVADESRRLWDIDEAERFIKLAITYPDLMNLDEQERWKMISDADLLGPAKHRDRNGAVVWNHPVLEDLVYPVVRKHWLGLVSAHEGGSDTQRAWVAEIGEKVKAGNIYFAYPKKADAKKSGFDDMSDDIPF